MQLIQPAFSQLDVLPTSICAWGAALVRLFSYLVLFWPGATNSGLNNAIRVSRNRRLSAWIRFRGYPVGVVSREIRRGIGRIRLICDP